MTKRSLLPLSFGACAMLVLILDGKTALLGSSRGLELCIKTVIPSLFPFLFLSNLITSALWGWNPGWLRPIGKKLGIPAGAEGLLITALLGGYPAGAQAVREAWGSGRIRRETAHHLLMFCSNAGPAFLFGMVSRQFPTTLWAWLLWGVQIVSSLATALLCRSPSEESAVLPGKEQTLSQCLHASLKAMAVICGWIMLMYLALTFLDRWFFWALPETMRTVFHGVLELSNGCLELGNIPDVKLRFMVCSGILSFGGLCVLLQTASVIHPLSSRSYLTGKLIQCAVSLLLSGCLVYRLWWVIALALPCLMKKRGSNLKKAVV